MSWHKAFKLFKTSLLFYRANFKRSLMASISIAISVLMFLLISLYYDFNHATYAKGQLKTMNNNFFLSTVTEKDHQKVMDVLQNENVIYVAQTNFYTSVKIDEENFFQLRCVAYLCDSINENLPYNISSLYSDGDDISNPNYVESFKVNVGRNYLLRSDEIIIGENMAKLLYGNSAEAINKQLKLDNRPYKIVGVFETIRSELYVNRNNYRDIKNGNFADNDFLGLTFVVFASSEIANEFNAENRHYYVIYDTQEDYDRLNQKIEQYINNDSNHNIGFMKRQDVKDYVTYNYRYNNYIKAILMLIIAIFSGISVFGTMNNSIADRKKEIGIKKALGASDIDIMISFVIENIINSLLAIVISLGLASLIFIIYAFYMRRILYIDYIIEFYPLTIFLFICYTLSVVIGFSLLPAYRATQIDVIDILRDE